MIIRYTKDSTIRYAYLNIFPDQFKTEKEKEDEGWIKNTMDYFANKAYAEYTKNTSLNRNSLRMFPYSLYILHTLCWRNNPLYFLSNPHLLFPFQF